MVEEAAVLLHEHGVDDGLRDPVEPHGRRRLAVHAETLGLEKDGRECRAVRARHVSHGAGGEAHADEAARLVAIGEPEGPPADLEALAGSTKLAGADARAGGLPVPHPP